eukprot:COSAG01_NODE_48937_length_376_cov_1.949458_1_plen_60_part_10
MHGLCCTAVHGDLQCSGVVVNAALRPRSLRLEGHQLQEPAPRRWTAALRLQQQGASVLSG